MDETLRVLNDRLLPEGQVFLVGGCVRDLLLGRPIKDLDFATDANPRRLASRIARRTGGAPFTLHAALRAYRIAPRHGIGTEPWVDVLPLAGTLEEDLRQRDFTLNAMALPVPFDVDRIEDSLIDPCGGLADLRAQRLRHTHPGIFTSDPVRLLRAVRIAAGLGFALDPETEALVRRDAPLLATAAIERVRDELFALLSLPHSSEWIRRLDDFGLLAAVLPEMQALRGLQQNANHHLDVWEHTLEAMGHAERLAGGEGLPEDVAGPAKDAMAEPACAPRSRGAVLLLATLLHDVAKPWTQGMTPTGVITFIGHDEAGAETARAICNRLRLSRRETKAVAAMVAAHLGPGFMSVEESLPPRVRYRFFRDTGDAAVEALLLSLADRLAARGPWATEAQVERHRNFVVEMLRLYFTQAPVAHPVSPVDGRALARAARCAPGPALGELVDAVHEETATGAITTADEALDFARAWGKARRAQAKAEAERGAEAEQEQEQEA